MGGAKKIRKRAQKAIDAGDYRWAAELLDLAVFADPDDAQARELLAVAHEQMAYQAESSLWRNMYLSAASELRNGPGVGAPAAQSVDFIQATPTPMLFDLLAVRLAAERAPDEELQINFAFPERKETFAISIRNGVLVDEENVAHAAPQATISLPRAAFLAALFAGADITPEIDGDAGAWTMFKGLFEAPPANFNIVTP
jgi:alkyl sulfatase BDS1-like metallo-beta-lactamase superfamily hydrolase